MPLLSKQFLFGLSLGILAWVQTEAKTFLIKPHIDWIRQVDSLPVGSAHEVFNALYLHAGAGDTLAILAGTRAPMKFENLQGDSLHPIVICNWQGPVIITKPVDGFYGLAFAGVRYLKLQGISKRKKAYGITITQLPKGNAISFNDFSSNIEICGVEISYIGSSGISIKTDPVCKDLPRFKQFVLYDIQIHHNYIHHVGNEGMYIGNSFYNNGFGLNLPCKGLKDTVSVLPHAIIGVAIYQNSIDSSGWDAIQVAAAKGVWVAHNVISYDSYARIPNQMSGIIIGQPCQAEVAYNKIFYSYGNAIECFGLQVSIHHNLIVYPAMAQNRAGIYINDKMFEYLPKTTQVYKVYENTIVLPPADTNTLNGIKRIGIVATDLRFTKGNEIYNNTISTSTFKKAIKRFKKYLAH